MLCSVECAQVGVFQMLMLPERYFFGVFMVRLACNPQTLWIASI